MEEIIKEALNKGVEMHVAGEFDLASQLYESVLNLQPSHADANHNMGLLKVDTGFDLEALPYLQTALEADISISQFWMSYIKTLIKLDRLDEATRILKLAKENGVKEAFLQLYHQTNELTSPAKMVVAESHTSNQSKMNILNTLTLDKAISLAKKNAREGSLEKSKRIYQDILNKFPRNKKARRGLTALTQPPPPITNQGPPQEIINQLMNSYNQGRFAELIEEVKVLIERYPDSFVLWNILGSAKNASGRILEASRAFKRVTQLNKNFPDGFNNLGVTLKNQGEFEEALEAYNCAIALNSKFSEAYNNMGNVFQLQGKPTEAIEAFEKAISLKPDYAEAYNNMGIAFQDQGKLEKAVDAYNKAVSLKPTYKDAVKNLVKLPAGRLNSKLFTLCKSFDFVLFYTSEKSEQVFFQANLLKHQGQIERSFEKFCEANKMKSEEIKNYTSKDFEENIENLERIQRWIPRDQKIGDLGLTKIFLFGPSRSGKSLLECLLNESFTLLPLREGIKMDSFSKIQLENKYPYTALFDSLFFRSEDELRSYGYDIVTSTAPESIFYSDYLFDFLPNTYFINIERDPLDVASEIFTKEYNYGNFYSYDRDKITKYLDLYYELYDILISKIPDQCITINYKAIVKNPNKTVEMISQFISKDLKKINLQEFTKSVPSESIFRNYFKQHSTKYNE